MRKTLYLKFLLAYLIFGFFGFLVVATFGSSMTLEHIKREKADSLYKEATLIANTYAADLYSNEVDLETVNTQMDSLSACLNAVIWIINPSGRMILDTDTPVDLETPRIVEGLMPPILPAPTIRLETFTEALTRICSAYSPPSLPTSR